MNERPQIDRAGADKECLDAYRRGVADAKGSVGVDGAVEANAALAERRAWQRTYTKECAAWNWPQPFPGIFVQISAFTHDGKPYGRSPLIKVSEDVFVRLIQAAERREIA